MNDTQRIMRDIEKHLEALFSIQPVVITGNNYEEESVMDARINSEMQQIISLAILTTPQEIQNLYAQALEQADAIRRATIIER